MRERASGSLKYYQFESLPEARVQHAIFTRQGGVSPEPWSSLNVGGTVGDDAARVETNKTRIFEALKLDPESVFDVWQVHSASVVLADAPRDGRAHQKADIILTDRPGVTLLMRFADCVPIMLYDPAHHAIGLAHAGWLGTVRCAARAAVEGMVTAFGSIPDELIAGLGPSIGPDHYEIGGDVAAAFVETFGGKAQEHLSSSGIVHLDLWSANRSLLEESGVRQIEIAGVCTGCRVDEWYSHRAEGGRTGRFAAAIALSSER